MITGGTLTPLVPGLAAEELDALLGADGGAQVALVGGRTILEDLGLVENAATPWFALVVRHALILCPALQRTRA